ncbi:hypothetical protein BDR06DRAFT_970993 [Suillus hirtellus]|nr:hypothetical protein BDR06DRAFT_970993 [Suillus hirtellus]
MELEQVPVEFEELFDSHVIWQSNLLGLLNSAHQCSALILVGGATSQLRSSAQLMRFTNFAKAYTSSNRCLSTVTAYVRKAQFPQDSGKYCYTRGKKERKYMAWFLILRSNGLMTNSFKRISPGLINATDHGNNNIPEATARDTTLNIERLIRTR